MLACTTAVYLFVLHNHAVVHLMQQAKASLPEEVREQACDAWDVTTNAIGQRMHIAVLVFHAAYPEN